MNEQRLFVWSLVVTAFVVSVSLAYAMGHADGKAVRKVCPPPPPVTPMQCASVWFNGEPGDMAHARARICPAKKGKS